MGVFKLSNGWSREDKKYDGKFMRVLAARKYNHPDKEDLIMPQEFIDSSDERITKVISLHNRSTNESYEAEDTYLLAVNQEYKEHNLVDEYDGQFACNVKVSHKAEVVLKTENWTKRLFFEWGGGRHSLNFYDFMRNMPDTIMEMAQDGELDDQGVMYTSEYGKPAVSIWMHTSDGDYTDIYMEEHELEAAVVSMRLIGFDEQIIDDADME